jgi:TrmH family RNA methyltransferase
MVEHRATMKQPSEERRGREASMTIRSAQHPLLKRMGAILAGKERDACVLEGDRLVDDARAANVAFECVLVSEEREGRTLELERAGLRVQRVAAELLEKKSALMHSPGIAAIATLPRAWTIAELRATPRALVLVVAGVSDPGNLGALARAAEALGASALVVVAGSANPWSDKALRGSMGSLLRLPLAQTASAAAAASELKRGGYRLVAAATRGGKNLERFDWSGPIALWVGPETGLDPREMASFERVTIPMAGAVESLNVTVAAALLMNAAKRTKDPSP